jgi:hypothetical protein
MVYSKLAIARRRKASTETEARCPSSFKSLKGKAFWSAGKGFAVAAAIFIGQPPLALFHVFMCSE